MFKLALNAGHGYETAGKRCMKAIDINETREYVLNKRVCDKIENILKGYNGIEILRIDDGSDKSITSRTKKANQFAADFYLSIHHNAGINGGSGGGIEAYTYLKVTSKTTDWQREFYNELILQTSLEGNRAEPLRKANLGECRQTKMSAVLLELGFMDSVIDTPIILTEEYADKCAKACANVILKKANLSPKTNNAPSIKTNEQLAKEVILGKWGNGADRKARLEKAGYDYSAIQKIVNKMLKG